MRPLVAQIHLDRLRHNYIVARQLHGSQVLALMKANAYGHGAVACARALDSIADGCAVSCLEEALELRSAGIQMPILLLEGVFEPAELKQVCTHQLWMVVHDEMQLAMLEAEPPPSTPYNVWLKMDSGMHRAGFAPDQFSAAHQRLIASGKVGQLVFMSHFSCADEPTNPFTAHQVEVFDAALQNVTAHMSLANSAAMFAWPGSRRHWGRSGIMLYGVYPLGEALPDYGSQLLKPVMQLKSKIMSVRMLPVGERIGYGAEFTTQRTTRVGLVACGYADGYPRRASTGSPVAVLGRRTQVIGRVSMDMLTVDLTDIPEAVVGSEVELWGDNILVSEVAAHAGTISYELLCNVKRAHFEYYDALLGGKNWGG